ncbi:ribosome hibernation-promoting factor, HPF/YfiA family [Luteimicrobium subarcticum]|uniref:Ribosome hibernation promoting factor n=1 Tax=Luteimicrobium subarcticum TaxID=620910 RepID=A0A2M8WWA9_9MICO|nr:ribosome-associated translation inhibitor RaiA [Luteimicrobium subarcticum]PJI95208.1 ribosomal subunit interface protein [Luteimicrobium subarcticum]
MEIVVVGRHTEVADRFRRHAEDKLAKVEQLSPTAQRVDVEVTHENNPRLAGVRERVELTVRAKGPVVRAEAAADDRFGALDLALDKLAERLRRARDRRKDHRTNIVTPKPDVEAPVDEEVEAEEPVAPPAVPGEAVDIPMGDSPVVIREKLHEATPMSLDEAIYQMEMVGHDFYVFVDSATGRPSAAYRRHGWTYGVVQLDTRCDCHDAG